MKFSWEHVIGALGLVLMVVGNYMGLFTSPAEREMGDAIRILYVHVPAAWTSMLAFTIAFVAAVGYLFTSRRGFDLLVEATAEVGVVLGVLLMILGALFAKPTWNVYWTWDARLTSTFVMVLTFVGVVMMRSLIADVDKRAMWSAVVSIFAAMNIPITYFSVRWWRSIHQMQSSRDTMDGPIQFVYWLNVLAFLLVMIWFIVVRYRIAKANFQQEMPPELPGVKT